MKSNNKKEKEIKKLYYFDSKTADQKVNFIQTYTHHVKGELANQPFILTPFQKKIIRNIFGWKRKKDGYRRYRTLYLEIPRKNGKSFLSAVIAILVLFTDCEAGAEIYSAAADREQANLVFNVAQEIINGSKQLSKRCEVLTKSIYHHQTHGKYVSISRDAFSKHGKNASGIIFDELHAQKDRELFDVLTTSVGARPQPLTVLITTAGTDRESICYKMHEYAKSILDGEWVDNTFYPVIYAADSDDDWTSPKTWKKANPNLGISFSQDFLEEQCNRAKRETGFQNTFKRLYLNMWTDQTTVWIPMEKWEPCAEITIPDWFLEGRECYMGMDLSTSTDLTALTLVFPVSFKEFLDYNLIDYNDSRGDYVEENYLNKFYVTRTHFFIPGDDLNDRCLRDRVPYDQWIKQGWIQTSDGPIIDYEYVIKLLLKLQDLYEIKEIAYDPYHATQLSLKLEGLGFEMVQHRQGYLSMNPACKRTYELILTQKLIHDNNPVQNWCIRNVSVRSDAAGNIKPDKSSSNGRIDGAVSMIMAIGRSTSQPDEFESIYKKRGIFAV